MRDVHVGPFVELERDNHGAPLGDNAGDVSEEAWNLVGAMDLTDNHETRRALRQVFASVERGADLRIIGASNGRREGPRCSARREHEEDSDRW